MRHLGKNLVIALALLAAGFFVAWLRFRPYLGAGTGYTDGAQEYQVSEDPVRFAVWNSPEEWGGQALREALGSSSHDRVTRSADGRWAVFVVGEAGLDMDLWIAEIVDGEPIDPHPLREANSPADERAPCFGAGVLYFASDRAGGAGGLDLYQVAFEAGRAGAVVRLPRSLQSAADDTDPSPLPGTKQIAFASNRVRLDRQRDYDLYLGYTEGSHAARPPLHLEALSSGEQEREPAFTADGRGLFFASDRAGGAGGFDLYRSGHGTAGWVRPVPLRGLNGAGSERSPSPDPAGFELLLRVTDESGEAPGRVLRARSLELFQQPGRPVGWLDLLLLALLLAVAVFAWLAKRWEQLDAVYKCFLVSLVMHLLLALWLHQVHPEPSEMAAIGSGERLRVRLVGDPSGARARNAERGGEVSLEREEDVQTSSSVARFTPSLEAQAQERLAAGPGASNLEQPAARRASERVEQLTPARTVEERSEDAGEQASELALASLTTPIAERGGASSELVLADAQPSSGARADRAQTADPIPTRSTKARAQAEVSPEGAGAAGPAGTPLDREVLQSAARGATEAAQLAAPTLQARLAAPQRETQDRDGTAPSMKLGEASVLPLEARRPDLQAQRAGGAPLAEARATQPASSALERRATASVGAGQAASPSGPPVMQVEFEAKQVELAQLRGGPAARGGAAQEIAVEVQQGSALVQGSEQVERPRLKPSGGERSSLPVERSPANPLQRRRRPEESGEVVIDTGLSVGPGPSLDHAAVSMPVAKVQAEHQGSRAGSARPMKLAALAGAEVVRTRAAVEPRRQGSDGTSGAAPRILPRSAGAFAPARRESLLQSPERSGLPLPSREPAQSPSLARGTAEAKDAERSAAMVPADLGLAVREDSRKARGRAPLAGPSRAALPSSSKLTKVAPGSAFQRVSLPRPRVGAPAPRFTPRSLADLAPARVSGDTPARVLAGPGFERKLDAPAAAGSPPAALSLAPVSSSAALDRPRGPGRAGLALPGHMREEAARSLAEPGFRPMRLPNAPVPLAQHQGAGPAPASDWDRTPYQGRVGQQKIEALATFGGSEATEKAVVAGLAYLARQQAAEGFWGSPNDQHEKYRHVVIGKTGLALLAFLGAGHTQASPGEYQSTVARAVDFLLAVQDPKSGHFGNSGSYSHAIATYALGECLALTKDQRLVAPLERAVEQILSRQLRSQDPRVHGGWGYYFPESTGYRSRDRGVRDDWPRASVSAWQVMALESAQLGGLSVSRQAFSDAAQFLRRCWDRERGGFRYSHDPSRLSGPYQLLPGSTPASLFALSLLGDDIAGPRFREARNFVTSRMPSGYRYRNTDRFVHRAEGNLYFWYYGTLALFRTGGRAWDAWNEAMKATLLPSQASDGSWEPISVYALDYAKDSDQDRSYSTALCVLTLEVYYRYFTPLLQVR